MPLGSEYDVSMMRSAIRVALDNPKAPFGSVIACESGDAPAVTGLNQSSQSPLLHGEIVAIQNAVQHYGGALPNDLTLYTTAEPCVMCMGAILWSGIRRVVYGTSIQTLMTRGWRQIAISAASVIQADSDGTCDLLAGCLEAECDKLFPMKN